MCGWGVLKDTLLHLRDHVAKTTRTLRIAPEQVVGTIPA